MVVEMDQLIQARQEWFDAQEMEQEARMKYIQLSDEFLVQAQTGGMTSRQFQAMQELLDSFLEDDEQEEPEAENGPEAEAEETHDQEVAEHDYDVPEGDDDLRFIDRDENGDGNNGEAPEQDPVDNGEVPETLAQAAAGRLRGAGRRNPLRG